MSVSGTMAMALLRLVKPGKGSFSDLDKCRERARRENEGFVFRMPKSKRAYRETLTLIRQLGEKSAIQ